MRPDAAPGSDSSVGHLARAAHRSLRVEFDDGRPWGKAVIAECPMVPITVGGIRFLPAGPVCGFDRRPGSPR